MGRVISRENAALASRWTLWMMRWVGCRLRYLSSELCGSIPRAKVAEAQLYWSCFLPVASVILPREALVTIQSAIDRTIEWRCGGSTTPSPHSLGVVVGSSENAVLSSIVAALTCCATAMRGDTLQVTWDFVNPKQMPDVVIRKLAELYGSTYCGGCQLQSGDGTDSLPHSATLRPLLKLWGRGPSASLPAAAVPPLLQTLERVGYDMLTKLNNGFVERCYYALPLLIDLEELSAFLRASAPPHMAVELSLRLDSVRGILRRAAKGLYAEEVRRAKEGYRRRPKRGKHLVHIPLGGTRAPLTISATALSVLSDITEPSYRLLRYRVSSGRAAAFVNDMRMYLADLVLTEWSTASSPSDSGRITQDYLLLSAYVERF